MNFILKKKLEIRIVFQKLNVRNAWYQSKEKKKEEKKKRHEMVFNVWLNKPIVTHDNRHYKKNIKSKQH